MNFKRLRKMLLLAIPPSTVRLSTGITVLSDDMRSELLSKDIHTTAEINLQEP